MSNKKINIEMAKLFAEAKIKKCTRNKEFEFNYKYSIWDNALKIINKYYKEIKYL